MTTSPVDRPPRIQVVDADGRELSATSQTKADRLLAAGKARLIRTDPPTIQLDYAIAGAPTPKNQSSEDAPIPPGRGQRILLHICCAPCATYTVQHLCALEFAVTGYWYNPNIHPFAEHELRRETLGNYALDIGLPMIWEPGYDIVDFMRGICGREQFRVRCASCYQMRLEHTAQVAAQHGFDAITTTLLISPYQDQQTIRRLGERAAAKHGVAFFFENLRRGWDKHFGLAREKGLYSQRYCGCVYSAWEAIDRQAATLTGKGDPSGDRDSA